MTVIASQAAQATDFTEPAPPTHASASGVLGEVSGMFASARSVVSGMVDLVTLEARRAGLALAWMAGLGIAAGILAITAWLGLMAALALWAIAAGLSPVLSILMVVVLNLVGAAAAVYACVKMSKALLFSASRRQLRPRTDELSAKS